jgi:alkylation response protein AidB-like acyl-CoA dehydrogenase
MQFDLDEERALLKASTRELLEKESPLADARAVMEETPEGYSKALYAQLGELGYPGLLLPEKEGGMGALAFAAVLHEMGRVAFPGPFLELVVAARALAACSGQDAASWRSRAAAGASLVVIARSESAASADPAPPKTRLSDGRARGTKSFVPFGAHADALLVETADGLALVQRPGSGWSATPLPTIDHAQRFAEIALDDPAALLADADEAAVILADAARYGALGASAILLGLMERSMELGVAYTMEREAFGAPIATFQGLQHRAADMLIATESTRSAVYRAAWACEHAKEDAGYLVSVAKAWAGPAARKVCGESLQFHGGVGFTWEYDPHIYLKRVKTLELFHGSTRSQVEAALEARRTVRA